MHEERLRPGLEGVVAAETALSEVDGKAGRLTIAGYDVGDLASHATFEEVAFLLWNNRLARSGEDDGLLKRREMPSLTGHVLRQSVDVEPIDALRMAVATLRPDQSASELDRDREDAAFVVAVLPTVVAAQHRLARGLEPIAPQPGLAHVANYLYMLNGETPDPLVARTLETYLNAAIDHGLNASTFVARSIASTGSDLVSAVAGAIGALKGPLHGGAPGPALEMVFEIGSAERAEAHIRAKLERGERLMGFGHRIYKVRDPRADVLKAAIDRLYATRSDRDLYDLAMSVEQTALRLLDEYKPGRNLRTNLEFYTALLLQGIGIPTELFTPTFALGRAVGWAAHVMEQRRGNRVVRPQSRYVGSTGLSWVP